MKEVEIIYEGGSFPQSTPALRLGFCAYHWGSLGCSKRVWKTRQKLFEKVLAILI